MSQNSPRDVNHSRYLNLLTATAVAAIIPVSIGVYLSTNTIFGISGRQTPLTYLVSALFFIPIILSLAERVTASKKRSGIFSLMYANHDVRYAYAVGWLMLGGLLFLGALLAYGGGIYLSELLLRYFETRIDPRWLAGAFILPVIVNHTFGARANWSIRLMALVAAVVLLVSLLVWVNANPPLSIIGYSYLSNGTFLEAIPYLTIGLWGLHFLLEKWAHVRGSKRQILLPMMGSLLLMVLLGTLTAVFFVKYPLLLNSGTTPLIALASAVHPLVESLLMFVGIVLALIGVDQAVGSSSRLVGEMVTVGFLPDGFIVKRTTAVFLLFTLATVMAGVAVFLPLDTIVGSSAAALSLIFTLLNLPGLLQSHSPFPDNRPIKLPLHPLFPMISIVISASFVLYLSFAEIIGLLAWIIAGGVYYFQYARKRAIIARQRNEFIGDAVSIPHDKKGYRLVVGVSAAETAVSLINAGVKIARARDGELLVIHIVTALDGRSDAQEQAIGTEAYNWVTEAVAKGAVDVDDVPIFPMVRIAPTAKDGINATIWEESVDGLLLGWPLRGDVPPLLEQDGAIDTIVRRASCEVMILRGDLPAVAQNILVPMTSEQHAPAALTLGRQLASEKVVAYKPVYGHDNERGHGRVAMSLNQIIAHTKGDARVEPAIEKTRHLEKDTISKSVDYDLLVMGISGEGFLATTAFGGTAVSITEQVAIPTILVKRQEKQTAFLLRRTWEGLSSVLPDLSKKEMGIVGRNMRQNGKADINFYVLLILAALIAFVGLLQNSAAVIIGAMLVAPLMSPILALAHSIVRGNFKLMRQAFNSTVSGVVFAIMLPTMLMLIFEAMGMNLPITPEIAARTEPGALDLVVALLSGAVAAFAVSQVSVAAALPGVAIAAALVPPLAVVGYGLGTVDFDIAGGAFLLFTVNFAAIVLSGALMFLLLGVRPPLQDERGQQTRSGLLLAVGGLALVLIPLILTGRIASMNGQDEQAIRTIVEEYWPPEQVGVEDLVISNSRSGYEVNFTLYDYGNYVTRTSIVTMQREMEAVVEQSISIFSRTVLADLNVVGEEHVWIRPTSTPTLTPTLTSTRRIDPIATIQIPPTVLPTLTAVIPTVLPTILPPTAVPTATPTITSTIVPPTAVFPTDTPPPINTPPPITATPTITSTIAPTFTATPIITATSTLTPTSTLPPTVAPTSTPIITGTPTIAPTATISATATTAP